MRVVTWDVPARDVRYVQTLIESAPSRTRRSSSRSRSTCPVGPATGDGWRDPRRGQAVAWRPDVAAAEAQQSES